MSLGPEDIPVLPRGVRLHHCQVRMGWFLLAPERAVKLDAIAVAILKAVDGVRDLASITAKLASEYNAPADRIGKDVTRFLADLRGRRMLELRG